MNVTLCSANNQDFKKSDRIVSEIRNQIIENTINVMFPYVGWPLEDQFATGHLVCDAVRLLNLFFPDHNTTKVSFNFLHQFVMPYEM